VNILFDAPQDQLPSRSGQSIRFQFDAATSDVRSVALAGTFNSWVGDACMLEQMTPTRWQCSLPVAPGRHLYKFVVDGVHWIPDPANPWISEDGQNNSCLTVDEAGEVFIRRRGIGPAAPGLLYQRHAALQSPAWLRDGVIYQLSVRAFGGSFEGVGARLDYLADLGVDIIWMMPVNPVGEEGRRGSLGDPYAVRDFEAIDPANAGSAADSAAALRALVDAIHARGMRVVYDWTLNRSSVDHPLTVSHPDWYTRDAEGKVCYAVPQRAYFAGFDFRSRGLRNYLLGAMRSWIEQFDFDGLRFDDSDITPTDFLDEIRLALAAVRPDIAIISQAYDEFHHLASCDLTYEGGTREVILRIASGKLDAGAFARYWNESTYSFPRGALRMRWLEDKEQARASAVLGAGAHRVAAALMLCLDGVPHILMGQEFDEPSWRDWTVLFDGYSLDWPAFNAGTHAHYRALIALRRQHPALRTGTTDFIDGLPEGVVGMVRSQAGERIAVFANLSNQAAKLPAMAVQALYAQGWDPDKSQLSAHGCLVGIYS
jgi:glycosidase